MRKVLTYLVENSFYLFKRYFVFLILVEKIGRIDISDIRLHGQGHCKGSNWLNVQ